MEGGVHRAPQALLEGYWRIELPDLPVRPHAFAHIFHDPATSKLIVAGYAFDANWICKATWRSNHVVCDLKNLRIIYLYTAHFTGTEASFSGLAVIDLYQKANSSLGGHGFFIDLKESPEISNQEFEKLPEEPRSGSPSSSTDSFEDKIHALCVLDDISGPLTAVLLEPNLEPKAFLSYVRGDDQHDRGKLTWIRRQLEGEIKGQTGEDFSIFQDNNIRCGEEWESLTLANVRSCSILIPILTPSFFNSVYCRRELEEFLVREQQLGRKDLILPILYIDCPTLEDPGQRARDSLASTLWKRQWKDWRGLRFEPADSPKLLSCLAELAKEIRDLLRKPCPVIFN